MLSCLTRTSFTSVRRRAEFGNPRTVGLPGGRFSINSRQRPSERSRFIRRILRSCGWGPARAILATAQAWATESIKALTGEKHGPTWASSYPNGSIELLLTRETTMSCTQAFSARCGATARSAAFTRRPTAARRGSEFSTQTKNRAAPIWLWTRATPTNFSQPCGNIGAGRGFSNQADRAAGCT